jgi:hypothetical protein
MRLTRCQTFVSLAILLLLGGCGHIVPGALTGDGKPYDFAAPHPCVAPPPDPEQVEVRYLGSGGIYLRWRSDAILIGPSFSNPNPVRAQFLRVKPDMKRIASGLAFLGDAPVRAIFAGHAHYDHIGDLPEVGRAIPNVPVYVNASGMHALAGEPSLRGRVFPLSADAADPIRAGSSIRVRAVVSGHAPQLCRWRHFPCVYAGGEVRDQWTTPLTRHRLRAMRGGQTLALVIGLYDGEEERFRIYYNDAAADSPLGQTAGDFDLAILCLAQWQWARDYPRDLLAVIHPRHVVVSHWDNFFAEAKQRTRYIPTISNGNAAAFLRIIDENVAGGGAPVHDVCGVMTPKRTMPAPFSSMLFEPRPVQARP